MTNNLRTKLIASIAVIQVLFFAIWYAYESYEFNQESVQIAVRPVPVDPRDYLSGQYFTFNYDFTSIVGQHWYKKIVRSTEDGDTIWIELSKNTDGFYTAVNAYSWEKPKEISEGNLLIEGVMDGNSAIFGIEKYFVPEGTATPDARKTVIYLNVYENLKVRIDHVKVNGKRMF